MQSNSSIATYFRICGLVAAVLILSALNHCVAADGQLEITVVDSETNQQIPVRVTMTDPRGRAVKSRKVGMAPLGEHFYLSGKTLLSFRRGAYRFTLDAGPEYRTQTGHFEIERHADDTNQVAMRRFADLTGEGWWSGDLDSQRDLTLLPLIARAEGLHYAPTTKWVHANNKWREIKTTRRRKREGDGVSDDMVKQIVHAKAARIETDGGPLLLIAQDDLTSPPLKLQEQVSCFDVLRLASDDDMQTIAATPTAWYLPVWVASGKLDAVMLITRQSEWRATSIADPGGRPRDKSFYPGKQGIARWGQAIYFHLLNAGVQIPPVAGSGSGANDSPLGTNRAYVHLSEFAGEKHWWEGVRRGAVVVTNGPLLRPTVGGEPPGAIYRLDRGADGNNESIDFRIALNLASRDTIEYLEVIKNGEVFSEVRLSDWANQGGKLPPVSFDASGWFAIRTVTNNTDKYQFALTAPYYVHAPGGPRISRKSVQFFVDWIEELSQHRETLSDISGEDLALARDFWQSRLELANAP